MYQDTRFTQINHRINKKKEINFSALSNKMNIILGSIDNKDWEIILQSIQDSKLNNCNLIIVPHEMEESFINRISTDIKELNLSVKRFTNIDTDENLNCIIYDKVGDLLDIYKYGKLAYVGCGFSSGVHNVLEPALQGCYVSYGPNISLLDEAIKMKKNNLSKIIYNSKDFGEFINISDNIFLTSNKNKILDLFQINLNQFEKIKDIIYES